MLFPRFWVTAWEDHYKLTSEAIRTGIRTGTSMKEYLTQTPLPPSIHVLQRLPMDKALVGVEETPLYSLQFTKIVPPPD